MNGQQLRWLKRELRSLGNRVWVILLAIALGVGAVNGVHSLADSIRGAIQDQSRPLMAADVVNQSVHPFPEEYQQLAERYETSETKEMLSMVSNTTFESILAEIKGVSSAYPLYGDVVLASGQSLKEQLSSDTVVVQRSILNRLGLKLGETLLLNGKGFTIP